MFAAWRSGRTGPGVAARVHDLREIVNAILYVNRTGIPWEYLPHDFPPHKAVYDYYAKWEADGTTGRVHDLLRDKTRRAHGRSAEPSAAVVDAQSVKTSANVAETSQGIDAGKKIKRRKRHLIIFSFRLSYSGKAVHHVFASCGQEAFFEPHEGSGARG